MHSLIQIDLGPSAGTGQTATDRGTARPPRSGSLSDPAVEIAASRPLPVSASYSPSKRCAVSVISAMEAKPLLRARRHHMLWLGNGLMSNRPDEQTPGAMWARDQETAAANSRPHRYHTPRECDGTP
jgi:hypothetical protein